MEFYIDNVLIGTVTAAPWSVSYNGASLASGSHIIDVTVTNDIGLKRSDEVIISRSEADTTAPGPVTQLDRINGVAHTSTPIKLSWLNPADSDLAKVNIYQSNAAKDLLSLIKTLNVTPSTSAATEFTSGVGTYYYIVRTVDSTGHESTVNSWIMALMLP